MLALKIAGNIEINEHNFKRNPVAGGLQEDAEGRWFGDLERERQDTVFRVLPMASREIPCDCDIHQGRRLSLWGMVEKSRLRKVLASVDVVQGRGREKGFQRDHQRAVWELQKNDLGRSSVFRGRKKAGRVAL